MEKRLILSRIQTPDGTILTSYHVHDYVTHLDKNGLEYMLDGGNEYQRYNLHPEAPFTDLSIWSDSPFEIIRQHYCRGGRGKNGDKPLTWIPLFKMSNEWLEACITYNEDRNMGNSFANSMYKQELDFRLENGIFINE